MWLHLYTRAEAGSAEPPPSRLEGKFVQILLAGDEHLCLACREVATFHANIVERFCREQGLPFEYNQKRDLVLTDAVEVVGGGRYLLDRAERALSLFGASIGYGPFERQGLKQQLAALPELDGYTVVIEPD